MQKAKVYGGGRSFSFASGNARRSGTSSIAGNAFPKGNESPQSRSEKAFRPGNKLNEDVPLEGLACQVHGRDQRAPPFWELSPLDRRFGEPAKHAPPFD